MISKYRMIRVFYLYSVSHEPFFFLKLTTIFIDPFIAPFHWKACTILHHKVNGPCLRVRVQVFNATYNNISVVLRQSMFIFCLSKLNELICPWHSLGGLNIKFTGSPSLFLMRRWVRFASTFPITTKKKFCFLSSVRQ